MSAQALPLSSQAQKLAPLVKLEDLVEALQGVLKRIAHTTSHRVKQEPLSVHERMSAVLLRIKTKGLTEFVDLFTIEEGRQGIVVSFIAILELLKQSLITIVQPELYDPIRIMAV